jgi:hypothetical protein
MWPFRHKKWISEIVEAKNLHTGDWLVTNGIGEKLAFVGRNDTQTFTARERINPHDNSKRAIPKTFENEEPVEILKKR